MKSEFLKSKSFSNRKCFFLKKKGTKPGKMSSLVFFTVSQVATFSEGNYTHWWTWTRLLNAGVSLLVDWPCFKAHSFCQPQARSQLEVSKIAIVPKFLREGQKQCSPAITEKMGGSPFFADKPKEWWQDCLSWEQDRTRAMCLYLQAKEKWGRRSHWLDW